MPARRKASLVKRLVATVALITAAISIVHCAILWYGIHLAEDVLVGKNMELQLNRFVASGYEYPNASLVLYADGEDTRGFPPIPESFKNVPQGFSERVGAIDLFFFRQTFDKTDWLIVQDQFGFEDQEISIYLWAVADLVLATLVAILTGLYLSYTIVRPVQQLVRKVGDISATRSFQTIEIRNAPPEIDRLTDAFNRATHELHQALLREKAFTADVSHELRTPITVISTSAELLGQTETDPETADRLDSIRRACLRLSRLVRVFLELARGGGSEQGAQTDLPSVAALAVSNWLDVAERKGLRLELSIEGGGNLLVDEGLSESVIDNLLRNAVQYTDRGSILVTVTDSGIQVADTGRGIPEGERDTITRAFVRGERVQGEGYGWGLSLVRRICEHEGWSLSFRDNPPKGTVFEIRMG